MGELIVALLSLPLSAYYLFDLQRELWRAFRVYEEVSRGGPVTDFYFDAGSGIVNALATMLSMISFALWILVLVGTYLLAQSYGARDVGRNIVFYAVTAWLGVPLLFLGALFFFILGFVLPLFFAIAFLALIALLLAVALTGYFLYRAYQELSVTSGEGLLKVLGILHLAHAISLATVLGIIISPLISIVIVIVRALAFYNLRPPAQPAATQPQSLA